MECHELSVHVELLYMRRLCVSFLLQQVQFSTICILRIFNPQPATVAVVHSQNFEERATGVARQHTSAWHGWLCRPVEDHSCQDCGKLKNIQLSRLRSRQR